MPIAFKEWSLVCDALGEGAQSLILRKGGIAEGRAGFQWKHDAFFLLPTYFHEQTQQLRGDRSVPTPPEDGAHVVSLFATVDFHCVVTDWERANLLAPHHAWTEEVIRDRFDYTGQQSLAVACLRIFRLAESLHFPDAPSYGGCRSWVSIPGPEAPPAMTPVLDEATHERRVAELKFLLGL